MTEPIDFSERYAKGETPWDTGRPCAALLRALDEGKLPGTTVLEIGCGTGVNAVEMARRGYRVTAVDLVDQAIQVARTRASDAKVEVEFRIGDVLKDNLGGPYDLIFDRGVYHALRRIDVKLFQEVLKRVTHPGSLWLSLTGNAKEDTEDGPPIVHEHEIRHEIEPLFEILELREFRWELNRPDFTPLGWFILSKRR